MTGERPQPDHAATLRICFVVLYYAPDEVEAGPDDYLRRTPIHLPLARELAARGHAVDVVHLWPRDRKFILHGVRFHFVSESTLGRASSSVLGRVRNGNDAYYQPAVRAIRLIQSLRPDVIHFHGSTLNLNLFLLLRALGSTRPPVSIHYHGGFPSRNRMGRRLQRLNFDRAARLCFTTVAHAQPFVVAGVLSHPDRVVELMETSSTFRPRDRMEARQITGMTGDPVLVSVGRLHPIKDPLTMLRGFERVLEQRPSAHLYLFYTSTELLPEVSTYLTTRPSLADHVHLRGRASFDEMESIYNSADVLLQASLREFSGCAVLEAMACGVLPVVTDLPSFRAMTCVGRFGALFPIGDSEALARQVMLQLQGSLPDRSRAMRAHFEQDLSYASMAEKLETMFRDALAGERAAVATGMVVP